MNSNPFFSIIVTFYNNEKYVEKCLNSIFSQKKINNEIIIIDDGSTDKTVDKIEQMIYTHKSNIYFIRQKHSGISIARNNGIKHSKGKYLIFVDGDDWLQLDVLYDVQKYLLKEKSDILLMDTIKYYEQEEKYIYEKLTFEKIPKDVKQVYSLFVDNDVIARPWRFIVNRLYILNNKIYFAPKLIHEDEEWTSKLLSNVSNISYYKGRYYYYRKHKNSITGNKSNKNYKDILTIVELIYKHGESVNGSKYYQKYLQYVMFRCIRNVYSKYDNFDCNMQLLLDCWYKTNYYIFNYVIKYSIFCNLLGMIYSYKKVFKVYNLVRKKLKVKRNKRQEIEINYE